MLLNLLTIYITLSFGILKSGCINLQKINTFDEARNLIDKFIWFCHYVAYPTKNKTDTARKTMPACCNSTIFCDRSLFSMSVKPWDTSKIHKSFVFYRLSADLKTIENFYSFLKLDIVSPSNVLVRHFNHDIGLNTSSVNANSIRRIIF